VGKINSQEKILLLPKVVWEIDCSEPEETRSPEERRQSRSSLRPVLKAE